MLAALKKLISSREIAHLNFQKWWMVLKQLLTIWAMKSTIYLQLSSAVVNHKHFHYRRKKIVELILVKRGAEIGGISHFSKTIVSFSFISEHFIVTGHINECGMWQVVTLISSLHDSRHYRNVWATIPPLCVLYLLEVSHQMLAKSGWAGPQQTLLQLPVLVTSHQWPGHWSNNNSGQTPTATIWRGRDVWMGI